MTDNPAPTPLEAAIGKLYVEFFRLRIAGRHQEEYDAMGTLIDMLSQDRQHLRDKHRAEIKI